MHSIRSSISHKVELNCILQASAAFHSSTTILVLRASFSGMNTSKNNYTREKSF